MGFLALVEVPPPNQSPSLESANSLKIDPMLNLSSPKMAPVLTSHQ